MKLEPSWREALGYELQQRYYAELMAFVDGEYQNGSIPIYPPREQIFTALWLTPIDKVKVVIIGQDPYHGAHQAHGLCFSVPHGVALPPSLKNIYRELQSDLGLSIPHHGCLVPWAKQGVLLLNTTLTVQEGRPLSHKGKGWERFTDAIVAQLAAREQAIVFMLWGKTAQEKCLKLAHYANASKHHFLNAAHPSPLAAYKGFLGCRHFSQANTFLKIQGLEPIDWKL